MRFQLTMICQFIEITRKIKHRLLHLLKNDIYIQYFNYRKGNEKKLNFAHRIY